MTRRASLARFLTQQALGFGQQELEVGERLGADVLPTDAARRVDQVRAVQRRLLTAALSLLSPGGTLVYVTCSLEPEENEGVVDAVLAELGDEGGVERVDAGVTTLTPYTRASGLVRVPPGETNDGFSLITLRKRRQPASAKG